MPRIDTNLPPLPALRAFAAAARLGSLSRAAAELNVSKSAISHQIRALEENLGAALLRRGGTTTRATPTQAGHLLLRAVEEALEQLGQACERIRAPRRRSRRRTLTVSANAPFCALWLAPRVAGFAARQPNVDVSLRILDDEPDWQRDGIDVAILRNRRDGPGHSNGTSDLTLADETVFPVASPILLDGAAPGDTAILTRHPLLEETHHSAEYGWDTWFARLNAGPAPAERIVRYGGYSPVIGAAVAGAGIALGRSPLVDFELASGRLVRLFPGAELPGSWRFVLEVNPYATQHAARRAFVAFLMEEMAAGARPAPATVPGGTPTGGQEDPG